MTLPLKIVLINVLLAVFFAFTIFDTAYSTRNFFLNFAIISIVGGGVDLLTALVLLVLKDKRYAQGFLWSGVVLILAGFLAWGICKGM